MGLWWVYYDLNHGNNVHDLLGHFFSESRNYLPFSDSFREITTHLASKRREGDRRTISIYIPIPCCSSDFHL
jgi:hypothetical protein